MSSSADIKMVKDEYDMMHDLNMHSGLSFASSTYEVVHKDFYNDFGDLFKPLVEDMKITLPSVSAQITAFFNKKK